MPSGAPFKSWGLGQCDRGDVWRVADNASAEGFHIAAAVVAASVMIERGEADDAVDLLRATGETDLVSEVDAAWRDMQLARGLVEVGQIEEARRLAIRIYGIGSTSPDDVSALALSGGAAILLFNTSRWDEADVAQVVTAADTLARWWVMITEYQGLAAGASKSFTRWARIERFTINGGSPEVNKLVSAAFVAGCMGDQADWAATTRLIGTQLLSWTETNEPTADHRTALALLVAAGDKRTTADAVRAVVSNGPACVVRELASNIKLDEMTRTSAPSTLALLAEGADVLDRETADRVVGWLLKTIRRPDRFIRRTSPSYLVELRLLEVLEPVVTAAGRARQREVARAILDLPRDLLDLEEDAWARLARRLDYETWTPHLRASAREHARRRRPALRMILLAIASEVDEAARAALLRETRKGSVEALGAVSDVRTLPRQTARRAINLRAATVRQEIADSQSGSVVFGSKRAAADVVIMNICHPELADWHVIVEFLEAETIPPSQKHEVLLELVERLADVPPAQRRRIVAASEKLADAPQSELFSPTEGVRDVWPAATLVGISAGTGERAADRRLVRLLAHGVRHKQWAPLVAEKQQRALDLGIVMALCFDPDPRIRSSAAELLATAVARGDGGELGRAALKRLSEDPGTEVPIELPVDCGLPGRMMFSSARSSKRSATTLQPRFDALYAPPDRAPLLVSTGSVSDLRA